MLKPSFSWSLLDTLAYSTAWMARAALSLEAGVMVNGLAGIAPQHYQVANCQSWPSDPRSGEWSRTPAVSRGLEPTPYLSVCAQRAILTLHAPRFPQKRQAASGCGAA